MIGGRIGGQGHAHAHMMKEPNKGTSADTPPSLPLSLTTQLIVAFLVSSFPPSLPQAPAPCSSSVVLSTCSPLLCPSTRSKFHTFCKWRWIVISGGKKGGREGRREGGRMEGCVITNALPQHKEQISHILQVALDCCIRR